MALEATRHLTVGQVCAATEEFAYLERACANVLAGWVPKVAELEIKLMLGTHFAQDMDHANRLYRRARGLRSSKGGEALVRDGLYRLMIAIDSSANSVQLLAALYLVLKRELIALFERHLAATDHVADAATVRLARAAVADHAEQVDWAKHVLGRLGPPREIEAYAGHIQDLWMERSTGALLAFGAAIWPPLDRVPKVARASHLRRGLLGALRVIPDDPLRNPKDIGIFLHSFLNEEITTLELVCRNSYEHPDMPWEFHADVARQAGDEARHASMVQSAASALGVAYGDHPIYVSSYEGQYEFLPCEAGSKRELLWRILLRQTFHEGLALDSLAFEVRKRDFLGQPELARLFEFLLADEFFHAQSGLRWSRYLCGEDPEAAMKEREAAHEYFVQKVKQTRARFVAENLDGALAEVDHLKRISKRQELPFQRTLNLQARRDAGFTDEEIQQVVDWGYTVDSEDEPASMPSTANIDKGRTR